jgi:molybdopterin synthase catalytic subunit
MTMPAPTHLLSPAPLSLAVAEAAVAGPDAGAIVTFTGTVRGTSRGQRVLRLEYEAYAPMALAQFARIAEESRRFGGARVVVHHRVGTCLVGEVSVVIAAAAPHRADAFDACRHAIEQLKADAAIWKREVTEDGAVWVGQGS